MKKLFNKKQIILFIMLALVFSILSCSNSYSEMFNELNGNFLELGAIKVQPKIGDEDFSEDMMIPNFQYIINKNSSLYLSAPLGAQTYDWRIELTSAKSNNRTLINRSVSEASTLYYQPTEIIVIGVRYELTLIATTKEGAVYTDVAELIFYE